MDITCQGSDAPDMKSHDARRSLLVTNKSPTDSPTSTAARATAVSRRLCTRAVLPTPLQRLDKLSDLLGGPEIWIKRDDCTGLAGGGNKVRKLVWLIADAVIRAADLVITSGAPAWVADMDFPVAPVIRSALVDLVDCSDLGYQIGWAGRRCGPSSPAGWPTVTAGIFTPGRCGSRPI